jgi:hypothetical protein
VHHSKLEIACGTFWLLRRWVNSTYLKPETWSNVAAMFREENSVQLQDFLLPEISTSVLDALGRADEVSKLGHGRVPDYRAGTEESGWEIIGPPHMQRYLRLRQDKDSVGCTGGSGLGDILGMLQQELFGSIAFARLLGSLTDLEPKAVRSEVCKQSCTISVSVLICLIAVVVVCGWMSGAIGMAFDRIADASGRGCKGEALPPWSRLHGRPLWGPH